MVERWPRDRKVVGSVAG